ncbi:MAG TPA: MmgE/PrpD family protein [Actinomycetota bacterium]|nr:MmgE/PrpD family protein [Actinomycetota bacterium]
MSDRITRLLARYASSVAAEGLPEETVHEVKRRVLDTIGVAVAGFDGDAPAAAMAYAGDFSDRNGATIWCSALRANPEVAGFANGVAIRYLDFNDTYLSREPLHPSDVIASLIALAEWRDRPASDLLAAIATAYEVSVSLCDAASLRAHGWDHVNYIGIGVACAAGQLLQLAVEKIEHAVSITTVPHAAMRETRAGELSMWKGSAAANAARNAVFATLLAEKGMTGPARPFEGEMAFVRQLLDGEGFDEEALSRLEANAPPRRILDTHIKFWPVEYHAQSAVDAALQFPEGYRHDADRIKSIEIDTFDAAYQIIAKDPEKWDPKTRETADHSLQYIVVAALLHGDITRRTFEPERFRDSRTLDILKERVTVREDPELSAGYPEGIPNRITVTTTGGDREVREVRYPRGHARNPMTDEEVVAKYRANVEGRLHADRAASVERLVWDLEREGSLRELTRALAEDR